MIKTHNHALTAEILAGDTCRFIGQLVISCDEVDQILSIYDPPVYSHDNLANQISDHYRQEIKEVPGFERSIQTQQVLSQHRPN